MNVRLNKIQNVWDVFIEIIASFALYVSDDECLINIHWWLQIIVLNLMK